jgi:hypothetical protein
MGTAAPGCPVKKKLNFVARELGLPIAGTVADRWA